MRVQNRMQPAHHDSHIYVRGQLRGLHAGDHARNVRHRFLCDVTKAPGMSSATAVLVPSGTTVSVTQPQYNDNNIALLLLLLLLSL